MKVLKKRMLPDKDEVERPKTIECEHCGSELEYVRSDLYEGAFGCMCLRCPVCDKEITTDEIAPNTITVETIKFPDHFYHTSTATGAVDICNQEKIREWISKGVKFFRENPDTDDWSCMSGNLYVNVHRFVGDEEYNVIVSNDYYEGIVPFQKADYIW